MAITQTLTRSQLVRSGIAHGGIGAGSIELRADGVFRNWRILNNNPAGPGPALVFLEESPGMDQDPEENTLFFIARVHVAGRVPVLKLLQLPRGRLHAGFSQYDSSYIFPWLSPVQSITCQEDFPFTRLTFRDPDLPGDLELEIFTPFIPHDVEASTLPAIRFRFRLRSTDPGPVSLTIVASLQNLVAYDAPHRFVRSALSTGPGHVCAIHSAEGIDPRHSHVGTLALASLHPDSSHYLAWGHIHPYYEYLLRHERLPNVDDTDGKSAWLAAHPERRDDFSWWIDTHGRNGLRDKDGRHLVAKRAPRQSRSFHSLAHTFQLRCGDSAEHEFALAWHFPNAYRQLGEDERIRRGEAPSSPTVGNHYATRFADADAVVRHLVEHREDHRARTLAWLADYHASSVEPGLRDQLLSHANTLRTNVRFTADGAFFLLDDGGLPERRDWGIHPANPDVAIYASIPLDSLFPDLQRRILDGYGRMQEPDGMIGCARSDWPGNVIQMVLRHAFWTHDRAWLRSQWPVLLRCLDFALTLDRDGDGVPDIGGLTNHCSYDNLPMHGLAAYIGSQWLSALAALEFAARSLGETAAQARVATLRARASAAFDERLWNGRSYDMGDEIGPHGHDRGCLTDQLFGQWIARHSDLGPIVAPERIRSALRHVLEANQDPLGWLRNATWLGEADPATGLAPIKPGIWNNQADTPWSGVELAFASLLIYEDFVDEGLAVARAVDRRHRDCGLFWDHQEAYGHYERPLAAWALLNALLGLSLRDGVFQLAPRLRLDEGTLFFSVPHGTGLLSWSPGRCVVSFRAGAPRVSILVLSLPGLHGSAKISGSGGLAAVAPFAAVAGHTLRITLPEHWSGPAELAVEWLIAPREPASPAAVAASPLT